MRNRYITGIDVLLRGGVDAVADQLAYKSGVVHVRGGRVDVEQAINRDIYIFRPCVLASSWTGRPD